MAQPVRRGKPLTPADVIKLKASIELWKATYADVLGVWRQATEQQQAQYLANSPLLAEMLDWLKGWE